MKILWFAHRDMQNPKSGGAERTIEEICKRLVSYGHDLHLFTVAWKNSPYESNYEGIQIHRVNGNIYSHFIHRSVLKKFSDADVIVDDLGHVVPWNSNRLTNIPGVVLFRHLQHQGNSVTSYGQYGITINHLRYLKNSGNRNKLRKGNTRNTYG